MHDRFPRQTVHSTSPSTQPRGFTLVELAVVIAIIAILIAFFFPAVRGTGPASRRAHCSNNLKQIALAVHSYAETYGCFPPAYTVDVEGNRLHSWRTLILPYLDQEPLYRRIDLSKPWDDPVNAEACKMSPWIYRCPESGFPENHTTYLAVITADSYIHPTNHKAYPKEAGKLPDSLIMVLEGNAQQSVPWMSPQDADESLLFAFSPTSELPHSGGVTAAFLDGRVRFLSAELSEEERRQHLLPIAPVTP